ncbi:MAG: DEAD/DEAH box helicase [Proteobacteria bacterium]|nr:DEAD/DEAH box helicase [Pseudomonadota bacterium]
MEYKEFLQQKAQLGGEYGYDPVFLPDRLFDFQKHIIEWAMKKGRAGIYADTGLGKTLMQLVLAENVVRKTNGKVLILTPLAVAFQFVKEAEIIGIDIHHSRDGRTNKKITVTNYERLKYFNYSDFECVILDESSILKNFDGALKSQITEFMKKIKYRYLSTATPSPNDFIELGTSSEALGYMGYMDMLGKYFSNKENTSRPQDIGTKWYLKPHAEDAFFQWVNSWSISIKKPSDLGFSNEGYDLPDLIKKYHSVTNNSNMVVNGQYEMVGTYQAKRMSEVSAEVRATTVQRCEKAVELAIGKTSVYWTNLNPESGLINELDKDAVEIRGSMSIDKKEDILINFSEGNIDRIITKPKMTSFGLNWQHCNHTTYFPTWSYERMYQAIRRFWRFGQQNEVNVDFVFSDGQRKVLEVLELKTQKSIELQKRLNDNLHGYIEPNIKAKSSGIIMPNFI